MRAATISGVNGKDCKRVPGGVKRSAIALLSDIASITFTTDKITGIAMAVGKTFKEFVWKDNQTATYVETPPTRESSSIAQNFTGQWNGIDPLKILAGDALNHNCELVVFHEFNDGTVRAQGIERIHDSGAKVWTRATVAAQAFVGTDHGLSNSNGFMPVTIASEAGYLSSFTDETTFDLDDILAL